MIWMERPCILALMRSKSPFVDYDADNLIRIALQYLYPMPFTRNPTIIYCGVINLKQKKFVIFLGDILDHICR